VPYIFGSGTFVSRWRNNDIVKFPAEELLAEAMKLTRLVKDKCAAMNVSHLYYVTLESLRLVASVHDAKEKKLEVDAYRKSAEALGPRLFALLDPPESPNPDAARALVWASMTYGDLLCVLERAGDAIGFGNECQLRIEESGVDALMVTWFTSERLGWCIYCKYSPNVDGRTPFPSSHANEAIDFAVKLLDQYREQSRLIEEHEENVCICII